MSSPRSGREAGGAGRRQLAYAVVACLAGAGLALFAATRTWAVRTTVRAAPLPALTETSTGADLAPWLPPLALVGLAGAGALLATRGAARVLVGVLAAGCGAGVLAGAGYAVVGGAWPGWPVAAGAWPGWPVAAGAWPGWPVAAGASPGWPVAAGLGGLALVASGVCTVLRGRRWPAMGARYEARPATAVPDTIQTWAALDRGEDPTAE